MSGFVNLSIIPDLFSMSNLAFFKYHGTGNDFILIDARDKNVFLTEEEIATLCHRHFGIGADGLMLLLPSTGYDFEMKYYNADGKEGSMCGNGGRCIAAFAYHQEITGLAMKFNAIDGIHHARILEEGYPGCRVSISLNDVLEVEILGPGKFLLDTGSPHYVEYVPLLENINALEKGKDIRWEKQFQPGGVNVNFVEIVRQGLHVKTYERGVENLTLSCGTGVTACAITAAHEKKDGPYKWEIKTQGGPLEVSYKKQVNTYTGILLSGAAEQVFSGTIKR